jgi:hypothetical protein
VFDLSALRAVLSTGSILYPRQRSDRCNAPWRLAAAWPFRWGRKFRPVAMSVLASGAIDPREAIEYVCSQKKIESIVFGASSKSNILNTKRLIDEYSVA